MGRRDSSQEIFKLKPSKDSAEFANLVDFVSHVSPCYPTETAGYAAELMALLDGHHAVLDANLRRSAPSPPLSLSLSHLAT
jgi:protein SDA1